ncbi:MAG: DUF6449 domain-containing protein [Thermincola sp.]|nr:DUF6449 domain-containing protein [Thermincola sp.]MDT3703540.1 DUF6449 domain-containing protein [Thermincola sp.]
MTSITSFKNWVIYKGTLKRLKWFGILYGVALLLELPLLIWMELSRQQEIQGAMWAANKSLHPQMLFHPFFHLTNAAVAVIFGLIIFYYLHNDRANTFFHSLPIKRSVLYCQNLLAGLTLIWLPILLNGVLIYLVLTLFGITEAQWNNTQVYSPMGALVTDLPTGHSVWQILGYWFFLSLLMTGLFLIFTVFVGMLTGNVLLQGALTIIGLFLPLGVYLLGEYNLSRLLYGFSRDNLDNSIIWLSPLVRYFENNNYNFMDQINWYFAYLGVTVLLGGVTIYLYKLRHAEAAGETLAAAWIRWVFKYGVAVCAAMTGGLYFSSFNENSPQLLYIGYFIGALLGYCISDMIAYKSFHFYKRWKGMVVFGISLLLLVAAVSFDMFGYETYIPAQDSVKEVRVSNLAGDGYMFEGDHNIQGLTTPENIEKVRLLHQRIIDREGENKNLQRSVNWELSQSAVRAKFTPIRVVPLTLNYVLKNGSSVSRVYRIDVNSYRQYIYPIFNTEEARRSMYSRFFQIDVEKLDQINVSNFRLGRNIRVYKPEEIKEALIALNKDMLNLTFEEAVEGKVPAKAHVNFASKPNSNKSYSTYDLTFFPDFKNFDAFLKKQGYWADLFVEPEEVAQISVHKVGSTNVEEIKDKEKIKVLLDWSTRSDKQAFLDRRIYMEKGPYQDNPSAQYFGEVLLKKGDPVWVEFEHSPYAWEQMKDIVSH